MLMARRQRERREKNAKTGVMELVLFRIHIALALLTSSQLHDADFKANSDST